MSETVEKPRLMPMPILPVAQADTDQVVYFIARARRPENGDPIKIGVTQDVPRRLEIIQIGSPEQLYLIGVRQGGRELEHRDQVRGVVARAGRLSPLEHRALLVVVNGEYYSGDKAVDNAAQRAKRKLREAIAA